MKRTNFQQFYVNPRNVKNDTFTLVDDESKHAVLVLRHKVGDEIDAVDGEGRWFSGEIIEMDKRQVVCRILAQDENVGEPCIELCLYHSVPKGNLFDLVIEKGTEIGISVFQPILTERSQFNPENKIERWQAKALAAMKQCGRSKAPAVLKPIKFKQALDSCKNEISFFAHESCEQKIDQTIFEKLADTSKINLFIGPEGGFTENEYNIALSAGLLGMSLGKRRLRSETAALAGVLKIFTYSGELD